MHSYLKQIERLLLFAKDVADEGCHNNLTKGCFDSNYKIPPCLGCRAKQLLDDEPVKLPVGKLMDTGEGYEQPVKALESPDRVSKELNPPRCTWACC